MRKTHQMVEKALVDSFLKGDPGPGAHLQSERDLAARFAVSRATVREALLKLQRSGWISVQQRHATIVNDFWSQGDLELLFSITRNSDRFPHDLAAHLLELRVQVAPDYARRAVQNDPQQLAECLRRHRKLRSTALTVARFDTELHQTMAVLSGNKIYPLIMNSFDELFHKLKGEFFEHEDNRAQALSFYRELMTAAGSGDADQAEELTRAEMKKRVESFNRREAEAVGEAGTA